MKLPLALACLMALLLSGCSSSDSSDSADSSGADTAITDRVELVTELMHRDAALLSLLDAGLGKPFPARVAGAVELARTDASTRIEAAADLLEEWDEDVPATVRDHGVDHGVEVEVPDLEGAPSQDEIHALAGSDDFTGEFTALFRKTVESTRDRAASYTGDDAGTVSFADGAEQSLRDISDTLG